LSGWPFAGIACQQVVDRS